MKESTYIYSIDKYGYRTQILAETLFSSLSFLFFYFIFLFLFFIELCFLVYVHMCMSMGGKRPFKYRAY